MNSSLITLRYAVFSRRADQYWFPAAFLALFLIMLAILRDGMNTFNAAQAYLAGIIPMLAGILSAYAVLDDPALELVFATPRPSWRLLLERLGPIFLVSLLTALAFQAAAGLMQIDLSGLGNFIVTQLIWLCPTVALMGLGSLLAFMLAASTGGALAVSGVWIVQVILRSWFVTHPVARFIYLFFSIHIPEDPALPANQLCLVGLGALCLLFSCWLLNRQERYI